MSFNCILNDNINSLNIIKNNKIKFKEKLEFTDIINLKLLKKELNKNEFFIFKDKKIIITNNNYSGFKKPTKINELLNKIDKKKLIIYQPYLENFIYSSSLEEISKNIFIDYLILIDLYNNGQIDKNYLVNYLDININDIKKINSIKNYDLMQTNKLSFELKSDTFSKFLKGKNVELKKEIISSFENLGLIMVEIPFNYNLLNLANFFKELEEFKNNLNIKKFNFILRFKKIKKYKKTGMFVSKANTIILDPRSINTIYHEIGHWIYENKLPFSIKGKRIFKKNFNKIINNFKDNVSLKNYQKYENYDLKSEIFAVWFENLILK